jgi:L-threonylcarbamoyladenylate synthase
VKIIPVNLKGDLSDVISEAVTVLKRGGVIVYPTDTVYGLGANACDWYAVEQVFKIKKRPFSKPLPIIARSIKWVVELAFVPPKLEKILSEIWPGPTTIILPKKEVIPSIVTAKRKGVGIRIPDYILTDKLLGRFGYPLTATSANISGEEATGDIKKIIEMFYKEIWKPDLILDAGVLPPCEPSTVLDLTTIKPKIVRVGPTKPERLWEILNIKNQNSK